MAGDNEGLEVSIEISHQRMLQRVAQIEARLLKLANTADKAFTKSNASAVKGFERSAKSSKMMTGNLRNMSQQLSQVVQQAQAGTNAFSALAMQLPDMVVGFGPVAILLGAVAGGIATIAVNVLSAKNGTDEFKKSTEKLEGILSTLRTALTDATLGVDELMEKYGAAAMQIRELIAAEAELKASQARSGLNDALPGAQEAFRNYSELARKVREYGASMDTMTDVHKERAINRMNKIIEHLGDTLGIGAGEAHRLSEGFLSISEASTFEEQEAALRSTLATVRELQVPLDKLPEPMRIALIKMIELTKATREAEKAAADLSATASTIPSSLPSFGGPGMDTGTPLYEWGLSGDLLLPPGKPSKPSRGGRGGSKSRKDDPNDLF